MRTPVIEALLELAPDLVRVAVQAANDKEDWEIILQDELNAELGNTVQTIEAIESIHKALKVALKKTGT